MIPGHALLVLGLSAAASHPPPRPEPPEDALADFQTFPGLEVSLWAESPELYNPTAIDVDARGRLWVTEAVNYRRWGGRNPGREHPQGDRVVILEDTDGDGRCDASKVFAQDEDLVAPLGIAVMGDRIVVSCSPHVYVYTDADGDDVPERRETLLTGFGGFDHDHGLHSFVAGPEGHWYAAVGNAGPHVVTDADGWTLRSGSYYSGGGPVAVDNRPGLLSDDGRVWTGGLVLSIDPRVHGAEPPRAHALRVRAHNFRNNYEVALDSFGNFFQSDNDDDGNRSCRTTWVMEGANYGFFSPDGSRSWQADRRPGQPVPTAHWHQDDPGVAPAGTINGAGGPTGVCVYEATLPGMLASLNGAVLNADAGAGVVYAHLPRRAGAGLHLEKDVLVGRPAETEEQAARWFRPSDVAVSTDGTIFVADWYDPGVGGHLAGDGAAYGRILRLAPPQQDAAPVAVPLESIEQQVAALASPAVNVRGEAFRRLAAATEAPDLTPLLGARSSRLRARGAFLEVRFDLSIARARDPHPDVRIATLRAVRALEPRAAIDPNDPRETVPGWLDLALSLARDRSPAVRAEVALHLREVPLPLAREALLYIARSYPVGDRHYLEAFGLGAEGKERELYAELVGEASALEWTPAQADLAWRLHPPEAVPALRARALSPELDPAARRRSIDALAFVDTRAAGEAMLDVALAGPDAGSEDGRQLAQWWVEHRDQNAWRDFDLLAELDRGGLDAAECAYVSPVLRAGANERVEIEVELDGASVLWLVARDGGDGNSCDWADWIEPRFAGVGDGARETVRLTELGWRSAEAEWGQVRVGKNCVGDPLRVAGETYEDGIGTHAHSEVAFEVPAGARVFRCTAGPDLGGTSQGGTSVVFEVYLERPRDRSELVRWRSLVADSAAPVGARSEALQGLAQDAEGGWMLIRMAQEGALSDEDRAACATDLFSNPDLSVRAMASEWFDRPGYESNPLPPIAELLAMDGDAARGRRVFTSDAAQCTRCHVHEGRGGAIGPDLTAIRSKLDRGTLFDAILNPSAGIAHGYETWLIETTGGVLHSGFILADGADLILKDTQGKRRVLAREEVAARHRQELSTMPEGVALGLSPQDLVDLVAFLQEDPDREPQFGPTVELFDGETLTGWVAHSTEPDVPTGEVWKAGGGVLSCAGRPIGYLRTEGEYESFELTLEWRFDPALGPGNSGVLLRRIGPDKVWPRSIEAQLHHRNAGDIWNIDEFPMVTHEGRLEGRRTRKLDLSSEKPLGEWNRYRILLDRGQLTLEVNGVLQNTATWCDVLPGHIALQSEGAAIEFRSVRLRPITN